MAHVLRPLHGCRKPRRGRRRPDAVAARITRSIASSRSCRTDTVVPKRRFSPFIHGSSGLEAMLRARGIDTVVITGTRTNVCCETTARDAMMLDFRTVMVSDATAAASDLEHMAGLMTVFQVFGDVRTTGEVIGLLEKGEMI